MIYILRNKDKKFIQVKPLKEFSYKTIKLAIIKSLDNTPKKYSCTEITSGTSIDYGDTIEEARMNAETRIDGYKISEIKKLINRVKKEHPMPKSSIFFNE